MEKKHAEERLKTLEREFNSSSAQFKRDQDNIIKQQAQIDKLKVNYQSFFYCYLYRFLCKTLYLLPHAICFGTSTTNNTIGFVNDTGVLR